MKNKDDIIREYHAKIGAKGGKSKSPKKQAASRANIAKANTPKTQACACKCHLFIGPAAVICGNGCDDGCKVMVGHEHINH